MKVTPAPLPGVLILEPDAHADARGWLLEVYEARRYEALGVAGPFVQDNCSRSERGTLRGLHLQFPRVQGKLVQVLDGEVFDVVVDVRRGSPHFGRWFGLTLSARAPRQLWIPPGFAHGFCVTSDSALCFYKCTDGYAPGEQVRIAWDDPALGVTWPSLPHPPRLSPQDAAAPRLAAIAALPVFTPTPTPTPAPRSGA